MSSSLSSIPSLVKKNLRSSGGTQQCGFPHLRVVRGRRMVRENAEGFEISSVIVSVTLRHEHNLAGVLTLFHVPVGFGDLIEWKSSIDVRANPAFSDPAHDLLRPVA